MTRANKRPLRVTRFQAEYLRELVADDLEETDLNQYERAAAETVVMGLDELMSDWPERYTPPK